MLWLVTVGAPWPPHGAPSPHHPARPLSGSHPQASSQRSSDVLDGSAQAELSLVLMANVRLTRNTITVGPDPNPLHAHQPSAALGHAPSPAGLDGELTPQLQRAESGGLPPACERLPAGPFCLCVVAFPAENEKQS